MRRFIKDVEAKIGAKQKYSNFWIAYIKAFLDVTIWVVAIYRISSFFTKISLYPVGKIFWLINRILFSVDIDPRADLAGGFVLVHGLNIVIGHEVKSLGSLKVYQGVTIGGNSGKRKIINGKETGQPVLEDNVTLGIDSKVLGPILIGKSSLIGTSAIITKDVEPHSVMVGNNKLLRIQL